VKEQRFHDMFGQLQKTLKGRITKLDFGERN